MLNQVRPINKSFCLQMLCEENYAKLQCLNPSFQNKSVAPSSVTINILEKAPYTQLIELGQKNTSKHLSSTNCFTCRIYLDTKSIEVISIEGYTPHSFQKAHSPRNVLNEKWASNYLLEKWLNFHLKSLNPTIKRQQTIKA